MNALMFTLLLLMQGIGAGALLYGQEMKPKVDVYLNDGSQMKGVTVYAVNENRLTVARDGNLRDFAVADVHRLDDETCYYVIVKGVLEKRKYDFLTVVTDPTPIICLGESNGVLTYLSKGRAANKVQTRKTSSFYQCSCYYAPVSTMVLKAGGQ
jgi:hypothetical protein